MINVCIHGHFYQPPRENPWTGEIELQVSAKPYHDWNERILHECYSPNTASEILNDSGEIVARVNNYEYISFNFGPTLLEWIRQKHPDTYKEIIAADRKSFELHNGHGNAIAMCYNHMIMPLANYNDKITQIKWGLADFKHHFGRESEGIWLPETACNDETIEVLISERIKYIILDPSQAKLIREPKKKEFEDVTEFGLDPRFPYRCYSKINKQKFISIFFYDGPVSKSVAFDDVLLASQYLLNKVNEAINVSYSGDQLVSAATDGETFGHHKKYANRTLAHFLEVLAPQNNLNIVNYGEYLEYHPAELEVILKNCEGTSWSCPHGVKRWKDDCGCGSIEGTNQKWRKPLREAMEWLRDQLVIVYSHHGTFYFKDVWKARNDYINVLLNNNSQIKIDFLRDNSVRDLTNSEIEKCFSLLEMQKFSMFMFTSCGWFYSEISGIETVKILEYAARAIEIAEEISHIKIEGEFLKRLQEARSNKTEYGDGRQIYLMLVKNVNNKLRSQMSEE